MIINIIPHGFNQWLPTILVLAVQGIIFGFMIWYTKPRSKDDSNSIAKG